jgi:peptidoglycan/LPS O-acetylase OafA/YrhL
MRDLPNLDFLRACAVLSVFVEHTLLAYKITRIGYWEVSWMGVVGVFLFFVHTSLVLMWSLERKPHTLDFYIRRIFRIYPLALLAVVAAVTFHAPVAGSTTNYFAYMPPRNVTDIVQGILLLRGISAGYLAEGVMWSLSYEVQMYLVLPVIFFFVCRNFSRWPLLVFWVFTAAICRPLFHGVAHNFFLCIPYFLPGIIAYVGFGRQRAVLPAWTFAPFLAMVWALFMIHPGWRIADAVCLVVGLTLPYFHQLKTAWIKQASHQIAKYSYGIYLAHPFGHVLGIYLMPHAPLAVQLTVVIGSTALLAFAAYHLLEYPMIRIGSRIANRAEKRYEQHELASYRIPESEIG